MMIITGTANLGRLKQVVSTLVHVNHECHTYVVTTLSAQILSHGPGMLVLWTPWQQLVPQGARLGPPQPRLQKPEDQNRARFPQIQSPIGDHD